MLLAANRSNLNWRSHEREAATALFGGVRGVIIPHQFVKAISDIFIINKAALPAPTEIGLEAAEEESDII